MPRQSDELHVLPSQLRPGDRYTDDQGNEWEVVGHPSAFLQGKMHQVRFQKPGDPSTTWTTIWPTHERVTVRREQR
jgi:hypothetical protein